MSPTGRPLGRILGAKRQGNPMSPTGRLKGRIFDTALTRSDKAVQ